jgi:hypothetical protein
MVGRSRPLDAMSQAGVTAPRLGASAILRSRLCERRDETGTSRETAVRPTLTTVTSSSAFDGGYVRVAERQWGDCADQVDPPVCHMEAAIGYE